MNLYVEFSGRQRYLNLKPINSDLPNFSYYRLDNGKLEICHINISFATYELIAIIEATYHLYTPASTTEELYTLHPECFI